MSKKELVNHLIGSDNIDKGSFKLDDPEWAKPPEKIKNGFLIQEAAKGIAYRKIEIQTLSEEK